VIDSAQALRPAFTIRERNQLVPNALAHGLDPARYAGK
jgi:hypothetical protein